MPNQQGTVSQVAILAIHCENHFRPHRFLVADIGQDDLILRYPFFEATNPRINWPTGVAMKLIALFNCSEWKDNFPTWTKKLGNKARKMTMAQQFAAEATDKQEKTWEELIPQKYHQYGKIFSKQASERFPGKRQWDHAIDLKPDAPTLLDCCVYPLSPREKEEQKKFLETNLCLLRIHRSKSQYASRFFLIRKKDRKFRAVQDY